MPYTTNEFETIFKNLQRDYLIYAPVIKKKGGRFSDVDLVTYDYAATFSDIIFDQKTYFSPKDALFPVREKMYLSRNGRIEPVAVDLKPVILFLRSCDIHALKVMDTMFLENGNYQDPFYKRRRDNVKIFLMECSSETTEHEAFNTCYCVSMKTNETNDYSVFIQKKGEGVSVKVQDPALESRFPKHEAHTAEPEFRQTDPIAVTIPEQIDDSLFKHSLWDEYSARCIACGRCNTSCPTCSCFSVQSISDTVDSSIIHRTRVWSSCQVKDFSRLAGDHNFRESIGERMRYKVLHKISDFKKRNGFHMCVGCGRCDDVCPEYISMSKSINKINEAMSDLEKSPTSEKVSV